MSRSATVHRITQETDIYVHLELNSRGDSEIDTGIGFLDHMLTQLTGHGQFQIHLKVNRGDRHIDDHHTVEDVGITLGQAFRQALGDRRGIQRFGLAYVPLDEALARVVVDLSNRSHLTWKVPFSTPLLGEMATELFQEWFIALAHNGGMTIHVECLYGDNNHHRIEACFKALARALRQACARDPALADHVPSTKGTLSA